MNAIFYKSRESGDSFKLIFLTEAEDDINALLDQLNLCVDQYITEEEFTIAHEEYMTIDVMDEDSLRKIAELTCKKIDMEEGLIIK